MFYFFKMKRNCLSTTENSNEEPHYQRNNNVQVNKIRLHVREKKYLLNPKQLSEHKSLDGKIKMSNDLVSFASISVGNIKQYIEAKVKNESTKMVPVYVTQQEYEEGYTIENQTISSLLVQIFRKIEELDAENQKLQEEIFVKTVKNKKKAHYIEFYYKLCELNENNIIIDEE